MAMIFRPGVPACACLPIRVSTTTGLRPGHD